MFIEPVAKCARPPSGGPCNLCITGLTSLTDMALLTEGEALLTEGGLGFA